MGWGYSHDQEQFDTAARLHRVLDLWWVLWSAPRRRFYGFWCGPQHQEPVHAPDEEAFWALVVEVEREHLGFPVSVPARASPEERLRWALRAAPITVEDHPFGVCLRREGRSALAAVRPTADDDPTPRWWVSWSAPDGARARPVARPGQEESVLAHVLDLLDVAPAPTRH